MKTNVNCTHTLPFIIYALLLCLITGCGGDKIRQTIEQLKQEQPQLCANKNALESEFLLIKNFRLYLYPFEIQLYSQSNAHLNKNQILLFIDHDKQKITTIPFYNNRYRDYWDFPFDKPLPNVPATHSSFNRELNKAMDKLIRSDDPLRSVKKSALLEGLFKEIVNAKKLTEKDSLIICNTLRTTIDIAPEPREITLRRLRQNYLLMKRQWHKDPFKPNYNCYFDTIHNRIYQLSHFKDRWEVITYRMDCGSLHTPYLKIPN